MSGKTTPLGRVWKFSSLTRFVNKLNNMNPSGNRCGNQGWEKTKLYIFSVWCLSLLGLSKSSFGRQVQVLFIYLFILILGSAISRNTTFVTHSKLYYTPGLIGSQNILYVKILVKTNKTYCTVKSSKISFAKLMTIMCSTF